MKRELTKEKYFGLGRVPIGIGAVLKGWNITEEHFKDASSLPVVDFRAMTPACLHDCFHCFTDKLKKTLTLKEIKNIIDQLAEMKTIAIDYLGEGEPTLDQDFFEIIEYTAKKGIQPIIFTDAATKLRDRDFVKRISATSASVCPKCDSLWNKDFQNWVVGDKTGKYFDQRNEAIQMLIEEGFNKPAADGTTRLGFDMVVCRKNMREVEKTLRYCRENNLWVIFSFYLPSGRSGRNNFDKSLLLAKEEKRQIQKIVKRVDEEYGFHHEIHNNFLTSRCVEFMCIYGDGRVSPCVGNENIVGNIKTHSIKELRKIIIEKFPCHDPKTFNGNCCYRETIQALV
ncbi:MAG: radical SAM protein [Patescibacteria group bacterium]